MMDIRYGPNWTVVILLSIFLPPVGVSLAIYKALKEKQRYKKNAKPLLITGILSCFYIVLGISECSRELTANNIYVTALFSTIGIPYVLVGLLINARGKRYNRYTKTIVAMCQSSHNNFLDISTVATRVLDSPEKAMEVIEELLAEGYLQGIRIDPIRKRITWGPYEAASPQQAAPPQASSQKMVSVVCKQCGGINKLAQGAGGICEYCDSPL